MVAGVDWGVASSGTSDMPERRAGTGLLSYAVHTLSVSEPTDTAQHSLLAHYQHATAHSTQHLDVSTTTTYNI